MYQSQNCLSISLFFSTVTIDTTTNYGKNVANAPQVRIDFMWFLLSDVHFHLFYTEPFHFQQKCKFLQSKQYSLAFKSREYFVYDFQSDSEKAFASELKQERSFDNNRHQIESNIPAQRPRHDNEINSIERGRVEVKSERVEPPVHSNDPNSQCSFRTDIEPKPDVQMLDVYESLPFENSDGGPWKQGWRLTYDQHEWNAHHKLKVFVVPHSHNDPGWIKTFDEYYEQMTSSILTSMLHNLLENPDMKFIWAEISYFSRWYEDLSSEDREDVKTYVLQYMFKSIHFTSIDFNCSLLCLFEIRLLKRHQLEFVTGGWVMPDEANSHWLSILQQLTEGQTWLKTHFNITPKSSWSIDPFGQSAVMPLILKGADFENMLIQRTHYEVKKHLAKHKQLEFRWRQLWGRLCTFHN